MQSNQQTKEELVQEFIRKLDDLGFISNLTGFIFSDPIHFEKSSEIFERSFLEKCARTTGKNPLTRQPLTLDDIKKLDTAMDIKNKIDELIQNFLDEHKDHPQIKDIEAAIIKERYVVENVTVQSQPVQPGQPVEPSADDLLAMGVAAQLQQQGHQNRRVQWDITADTWNRRRRAEGGVVRYISYRNRNALNLADIQLQEYTNNTYSISILAGYCTARVFQNDGFFSEHGNHTMYLANCHVRCNQALIAALNHYGFNADTAHVISFPDRNTDYSNVFTMRAPLLVINAALANVLNCVEVLEGPGSVNAIRDQITNLLQVPILRMNLSS
jgi:hypothetical protein